jgi:DNA helicase-2/ATP-dependent DNA helicase PcrA
MTKEKDAILADLNEEQRTALLQTEGAVLVTAGAGSGKTRLLTHRISYLVKEKGVDPYNILAITFTNKAAREMKERTEKMLEDYAGSRIWISTFHSMCARILRNDIEELGTYTSRFTIYSEQDSERVYKKIFTDLKIDKDDAKKSIVFHISNLKNNNMNISEYERMYSYLNNFDLIKKVYFAYEKALYDANALDFNDLLNKTYQLFTTCPHVLERYQNRFHYILVDEFQDTNRIQYDLIKLLSGKYKNIFVVGDEDQCIYTWRGANFSNIFDFERDFENTKIFKLERNYRSTKNILNLANKLIKNNKSRMEKRLWTENDGGREPEVRLVYDEKEEAEIVAREIYDLVRNYGYKYSDFAVLLRLNALSFAFEEKFLTYNIPYRIYGGFKFYERAEIKNLVSYLRLFLNPRDEVSLLRIINFPKRGIGDGAISALKEISESNGVGLLDAVLKIEDLGAPSVLTKKLADFKEKYINLLSDFELQSLTDFVASVVKTFGIKNAYNSGSEEDIDRNLNIDTFISAVKDFENSNPSGTLLDFLESVTLVSDIDTMDEADNYVAIATIHSVKGLEFKYVFIVGLEERTFPISRAFDKDEDMEEERRLMYVAITRAKERIMLSRCRTRFLHGKREYQGDSRFLKELGFTSSHTEMAPNLTKTNRTNYIYRFDDVEYNEVSSSNSKYKYQPIKAIDPMMTIEKSTYSENQNSNGPTKYEEYMEDNMKNQPNNYKIGQTVLHPKFGIGKIIKLSGNFGDIDFDKLGIKTLLLDISPLKILK